ncbi:response regulator transcription factor [Streptomyces sp. JJ36]|uniref:response regulator transcription factor n=1 Tax=Streptomyces sp. JJ36 TaxID=2736645 RepID=UPI001F278C89|nr:response regulator transcription factor [Streptomyces sp. JJ36]MCF6521991.1 response regulator transcription factor [Streptomyces sp. JJ36]
MIRVLLVEDDEATGEALSTLLRGEGFEVDGASTGRDGLRRFQDDGADLILLDWMLPEISGLDVCRTVRQESNVPIIMVTGKDSEIDKVVALEVGADDYVVKPYSSRELIARMRAVVRGRRNAGPPPSRVLESGPVRMDLEQRQVTVSGEEVPLPLREYELLGHLLRHAGRVTTKRQIADGLWGVHNKGVGRSIDVHIRRLRMKIEPDPKRPRHLLTVRGVGYKFQS